MSKSDDTDIRNMQRLLIGIIWGAFGAREYPLKEYDLTMNDLGNNLILQFRESGHAFTITVEPIEEAGE